MDIVIGHGEIGNAVSKLIGDPAIVDINLPEVMGKFDVMHICYPYSERFIQYAHEYILTFNPNHIVIWSTVPIGTTKLVSPKAVHSPVEGKHPHLAKSIKLMPRWVGYNNRNSAKFFDEYFRDLGLKVRLVPNSAYTEALKLLSTTEYGLNIIFADYKAWVARSIGMDFDLTKDWNKDYNQLYRELGLNQFQKFILDPPNGVIGGHCVLNNLQLLAEHYPNDILNLFKEYANADMGQ
jgi:hypothetical protein